MASDQTTDGGGAPSGQEVLRALLRDRRYLRIWAIGAITSVVRWGELLAIGLYVLRETGSPAMVAFMAFLRLAPMFAFGLIWGALADRFDRKRLLLILLSTLTLASATLTLLAWSDLLGLWHVAIGTVLAGMYFATEFPVRRTLVGEIARPERLGAAMSLEAGTTNAMRMLGPALYGAIFQLAGMLGIFALGTLMYAVAALVVRPLPDRVAAMAVAGRDLISTVREGLAHARASRSIMATLAITIIVNLFGFAYIALAPVIGARVLHLSPAANGLLLSAEGLGALVGATLVGLLAQKAHYPRVYLAGSTLFVTMVLIFALSRSYWLSLAVLFVSGMAIAAFASMQSTLTFLAAPIAMRARMMGVLTVCIGTGPLGMLHAGLLADWLGAANAVATITTEGLIALGLAAWWWPELWRPGAFVEAATVPSEAGSRAAAGPGNAADDRG